MCYLSDGSKNFKDLRRGVPRHKGEEKRGPRRGIRAHEARQNEEAVLLEPAGTERPYHLDLDLDKLTAKRKSVLLDRESCQLASCIFYFWPLEQWNDVESRWRSSGTPYIFCQPELFALHFQSTARETQAHQEPLHQKLHPGQIANDLM